MNQKKKPKIMNTKKTKKNVNVTITVKLLNITDPTDAYKLFAIAKFNNMRDTEKDIISKTVIDLYFNTLAYEINSTLADMEATNVCKCREKKPNIFKRFWNWITRKK